MKKLILILFLSFIYSNIFGVIQHEIDSIKAVIKTEKIDSILIKSYLNLSIKYAQENNDSALLFAERALTLSNQEHFKKEKIVALSQAGHIHFNLGNLPLALKYFNQSLIQAKAINYSLYIAQNYKLIGALYGYEKEYEHALNYQKKALSIFNDKKDTINIAKTYDNIAVYYRRLAIYDSSKHYLNLAIEINKQLGNYRSLSFNYNNMGSLFLVNKNLGNAEKYYLKSLALKEEYGLRQDLLQSYNNLGNLYYKSKKYHKAISYFNSCINISNEIKIIKHLPLFYRNLSNTYYDLGNYALALEYKKYQKIFSDSISSTETQILIANQESEIKKMEQEYQQLLTLQEMEGIEKLILKKSILIAILTLISLIAFYIISYSIKHYRLQKSLIKQEASLIAIKGAEKVIAEKERAAQKINLAQEALTEEIAETLNKKVIEKLKNIQTRLTHYLDSNPKSELIINRELIHLKEAIQFIDSINSNLQPPIFKNLSFVAAINKYLNTTFDNLDIEVDFRCMHPEIINQLEKELSRNIYRIIQELSTNILKYAKASIINIEIANNDDHLLLRVQDNGIGFDANNNKEGLGLTSLKHRAQLYNGSVIINTKKGKGTEILINMNYKKA